MHNILEGLKIKNRKGEAIPNCDRKQLPEVFKELGLKRGVEIGVDKGAMSECFAKVGLEVFAIDPWRFDGEYMKSSPLVREKRLEEIYESAKEKLSQYPNCTIIRKTSMEALEDFEDNSLDFVYIDGHHGFKFVTEDIYEWTKKVRSGGIISGHDYIARDFKVLRRGVIQTKYVIDAYTQAFRIPAWWILGREERLKGEKREECRSWMWFKE